MEIDVCGGRPLPVCTPLTRKKAMHLLKKIREIVLRTNTDYGASTVEPEAPPFVPHLEVIDGDRKLIEIIPLVDEEEMSPPDLCRFYLEYTAGNLYEGFDPEIRLRLNADNDMHYWYASTGRREYVIGENHTIDQVHVRMLLALFGPVFSMKRGSDKVHVSR